MNYIMEYGKPCEYLGETEDGKHKVRITGMEEVTEKIINYKPIEDVFKYDGFLVKDKHGVDHRLKRYTTYEKNGELVRVYKAFLISYPRDITVYESEVGNEYVVIENKYKSREEIGDMLCKRDDEKYPLEKTISNLKKDIKKLEEELEEIDKKYNIDNLCCHEWEETGRAQETDTKEAVHYRCEICEEEKTVYWHKIF